MPKQNYPPVEYVRQCLRYEDGKLFWKERPREHFTSERTWKIFNDLYARKEAGYLGRFGDVPRDKYQSKYAITISYNGRKLKIYRAIFIWSIHNNQWPSEGMQVDHKDTDTLNDRIENLRLATNQENNLNKFIGKMNTSGYKGVSFVKSRNKYLAQIHFNGRGKNLGRYDTAEEAKEAYDKAAKKLHGEFFNSG